MKKNNIYTLGISLKPKLKKGFKIIAPDRLSPKGDNYDKTGCRTACVLSWDWSYRLSSEWTRVRQFSRV